MDHQVKVPDMGTTTDEIEIVEWLVAPGDTVTVGQELVNVETDKATMPIEATVAGKIKSIDAQSGQQVVKGDVIAVIDTQAGAARGLAQETGGSSFAGSARPQAAPNREPRRDVQTHQPTIEPADIDINRYDHALLVGMYDRMCMIRTFEERVKRLFLEGDMPGTIHQCQGQEACAVGVCSVLRDDDWITSTFRGTGHALAKGLTVEQVLFELFGAETGCCRGRGGSMHLGDYDKHMVPGIAIVGGSVPLAAGMGLAFKMQGSKQIAACFFGDGAIAEGAFHEGLNLAAIWNLPSLFICENNQYGASTSVKLVMRNERISQRAQAYGIAAQTVDGNDVLAVYEAARVAADTCRNGDGPVLLELLTYRRTGHSRRDPCHYQPDQEQQYWFGRDPIDIFADRLAQRNDITADELDSIRNDTNQRFDVALAAAPSQPLPSADELTDGVYV